jgi:NAD-dependent SIR2 family protein deacetylase
MTIQEDLARIHAAASLIRSAKYLTAFTGAGISVESGIPPFRGEGGLWNKYDPRMLELDNFLRHPEKSWPILREIFYEHFGVAKPNRAHEVLARLETEGWPQSGAESGRARAGSDAAPLEARGYLCVLITQNIDSVQ